MKVGQYQIGRYHAIIKKMYADNSVLYETRFSDEDDLQQSVYAIASCVGKLTGIATSNPQTLTGYEVIRGKEAIIKELAEQ